MKDETTRAGDAAKPEPTPAKAEAPAPAPKRSQHIEEKRWSGLPLFICAHCGFDRLKREVVVAHLKAAHGITLKN